MKKVLSLVMALTIILSLTACGGNPVVEETHSQKETTAAAENTALPETEAQEAKYEITYTKAKTWTDSIGSQWVQVIAEITNTGTSNLYLSSGAYDLEDKAGNLVASGSLVSEYPNVLAPGEKGYLYNETIMDEPVKDELTVKPRVKAEEATVNLIRYGVSDTKITNEKFGGVKIIGRVENTGKDTGKLVNIVGILYDANKECIGLASTILMEDLEPGAKMGFEISGFKLPDDVNADRIAEVVYYAYPEQLQF